MLLGKLAFFSGSLVGFSPEALPRVSLFSMEESRKRRQADTEGPSNEAAAASDHPKRQRLYDENGAQLEVSNHIEQEELKPGEQHEQLNGGEVQEANGEEHDDEREEDQQVLVRGHRNVEVRKDCPYLDTVNRQVRFSSAIYLRLHV